MLLDEEQYRILLKRITGEIENARYYPATAVNAEVIARHILRAPFTIDKHNSGRTDVQT